MKKNIQAKGTHYIRPPIVTVMGHVDHGKTSLLDAIKNTQVVRTESGGITQHIGAYTVLNNNKKITFIDTPGHEAFSQMRSRGGAVADIVILVVAADDGVMPQTKEAISHALQSNAKIIVAINKIDLPGADPIKIKKQLAQDNIMVEGYGGDVVAVEVSATKKIGIDNLLNTINLVAEVNVDDYQSELDAKLEAIIIESKKDPRKGVLVTVVVKNGILEIGEEITTGQIDGKVKSLSTYESKNTTQVLPGEAVEIMGFTDVPAVGQKIYRKSEYGVDQKSQKQAEHKINPVESSKSETNTSRILNVVVRADTYGTQEAICDSLKKLAIEDAQVNILLAGTGPVKESDVLLASSSTCIILAFKVAVSDQILALAKSSKVIISEYEIIYKLIEDIQGALEGVVEIEEAKIKGKGFVIDKFTLPKSGAVIAGVFIEAGKFKINNRVGIFRGASETPLFITRVKSIHVGKNEVETANKGVEAGLMFKPQFDDIQLDDAIKII